LKSEQDPESFGNLISEILESPRVSVNFMTIITVVKFGSQNLTAQCSMLHLDHCLLWDTRA